MARSTNSPERGGASRENGLELLQTAVGQGRYRALCLQLQSEFAKVGTALVVDDLPPPDALVSRVTAGLGETARRGSSVLTSLCYQSDIPESHLEQALSLEPADFMDLLTFLLLRRCWQKVLSREKYK